MRVGLDISNAIDPRASGVARYIRNLHEALRALPDAPELQLLCRPSRLRRGHPETVFPGARISWLTGLPIRGIDLLHAPDLRLPRFPLVPLVVTIHDLSALERDDHASPGFLRKKRRGYLEAAKRAQQIITHTEAVRNNVVRELAVPSDRVTAVHLADALPQFEKHSETARQDRLLLVGGPSVRKGSERLGQFMDRWEAELGWTPEVDWVGSTPAATAHEFFQERLPQHRGRIRFHGHTTDEQLDSLYRAAMGLLVLSPSEGFCLPLLEAAQRHCPVLACDSPVLREVLGNHAFWMDEDSKGALECVRRFRDTHERKRIATGAWEEAQEYSWNETARQTLDVYRRVTGSLTPQRD